MDIEFCRLDLSHPEVVYTGATFDITDKRGVVTLNFDFKEDGMVVGTGVKKMVASGLKPYEQTDIDDLVTRFNQRKDKFLSENQ